VWGPWEAILRKKFAIAHMNVDMKEDGKHGWEETRNEKAKG